MRLASIVLVLSGCLSASGQHCADGRICPDDTTCDTDHGRCTSADEVAACDGLVDGAVCKLGALDTGHCDRGVCLRCGDGILNAGEVCDDGNLADNDGCSADCQSTEICGNGTTDRAKGETCDDGNHLDHDGCSSACQTEAPRWIRRPALPPGRAFAGVAYDASRDRIVMAGGRYLTDTWEWRGAWEQPAPTPALPVLAEPTIVYDTLLHRTLLFGGDSPVLGGPSGGLFEWDGLSWQPGPDGPKRYGQVMAYDSHRHKAIVFGGDAPMGEETLEFDSATSTWAVKVMAPSAPTPAGRGTPAMAYDPKRGVVVLFGGVAGSPLGDTWEYDGTAWRMIAPSGASPSPRYEAAMAFDPTLQEVVLFGGATGTAMTPAFVADTWSWNGTRWNPIATAAAPTARGAHTLVATAANLYLFGGAETSSGTPGLADTWRFDHTTWTEMDPPPSVDFASAVMDTRHGRAILVGGMASGPKDGDETWELARTGPRLLTHSIDADGPGTVTDSNLGYDPDRDQLVLFSGLLAPSTPVPGTWTWTGTTWQPASPTVIPSARTDAGLAWDPVGHTLLMFGGLDLSAGPFGAAMNDTWRWTGSDWAAVTIDDAQRPPARTQMAIATDPVRKQIVMFGGVASADSRTWIWNGTAWEGRDVTPHPPVVSTVANLWSRLAWNPARQKLVLLLSPIVGPVQAWEWDGTRWEQIATLDPPAGGTHGGWATTALDGSGVTLSVALNNGETAALRWDTAAHDERCDGSDLDGDLLTRCADPDCWWTCAALCPPGTSCDPAAPACGDHHCDPTESCATCPGDCGDCATVCGDFVCDPNETCPGDCP